MLQTIAFYIFATLAVASAFLVISARNPVHSVLFLILTFITSACLFVLIGAEYLAMLLIVVYVGAVAVLFLFVVMMLDIDFVELRQGFLQYLPVGAVVALIVLAELILVVGVWVFPDDAVTARAQPTPPAEVLSNAEALGRVLYTDYVHLFQISGMILLVAMVGAIVLTLTKREDVKRQDVGDQVGRKRDEGVELVDVKPGQGI